MLHEDFDSNLLVPVIFSHGLMGNRRVNFNQISELVSNGCVVYAITHTDGTASMYDKDKEKHGYIVQENPKLEPGTPEFWLK